MNKNKKNFLFLGIIFAFLLEASSALALELHYPTIFGFSVNDTSTLPEYARYFFNLGMALAGFIAVAMVAYGGIYYLISYGRGKFTDEGKDKIKSGLYGLLIVVCAYLIAYTINPALVAFKLGNLPAVFLSNPLSNSISPNAEITNYQEIPIGVLTENLLSRTMGCYGFDTEGNPIDGPQITDDDGAKMAGPTYLDHDRADCLLQLVDGAQKKGQVIAKLSQAIMKLMNTCNCQNYGQCSNDCNKDGKGCDAYKGMCPLPQGVSGLCTGKCVKAPCFPPQASQNSKNNNAPQDCCPTDSGVKDPNDSKRNLTVKELIEHGPIKIEKDTCQNQSNDTNSYAGLDEYRSQFNNNYDLIKQKVETQVTINKKQVSIIKSGNCQQCNIDCGCNYNCPTCPDNNYSCLQSQKKCQDDQSKCLADQPKCLDNQAQCQDNYQACQKKNSPWYNLRLIDQLTYFQGKINEIKQKIKEDQNKLDQARGALGQCYLAIPYVDLLKTYQSTDQKAHVILTQKPFSDPETSQPVDASKYCKGFNYSNSSCLKKCNDMCPDTSDKAMQCYEKCDSCDPTDLKCQNKQENCIEDCYNSRPCPYGSSSSQNFGSCLSSCQNDCTSDCAKKYSICSSEYNVCNSLCDSNSQCVLNSASDCLFDAQAFQGCASQNTDQGNAKHCIDNAYLCKNGSNEYAGYQDCVDTSSENGNCSSGNYSASFLYDSFINNTPGCELCPYPYDPPEKGTPCYSKTNPNASCQQLCPETTKCPAASNCPDCPCDQIDNQTVVFSIPNISYPIDEEGFSNADDPGYSTEEQKISAYQIVGPQCNEYSYNDDPLTFYCENDWWNDPNKEGSNSTPIGAERECLPEGEVPVGQTVDDAKNWADSIEETASNSVQNIQGMLDNMIKIGKAQITSPIQDYCKCNAKYETSKPICTTDCKYTQAKVKVPIFDDNGDQVGEEEKWNCNCSLTSCNGSPCQQLVDYLQQVWNDYRQLKIDFVDFYTSMLQEPRSDIMKELTYSRQQTDNCSLINSAYGLDTRLLSCTRVEDEMCAPVNAGSIYYNDQTINDYCYGISLGNLFDQSLTDNWFCAQEWQKNPVQRNQPQ